MSYNRPFSFLTGLERPELEEIRLNLDIEGLLGPEAPIMKEFSDKDRLYLDDLQIGQRFTSGTSSTTWGTDKSICPSIRSSALPP